MKMLWGLLFLAFLPGAALAQAQGLFSGGNGQLPAAGWAGFLDMHFMADALGALVLAIVLGAVIGYHPTAQRTVDTLEEAELPKVFIMYAFIGAVIGVTVREFGMVIGVVVFGIGGLIRFRTSTASARDTGRLIVVTLAGLIAGLGLPHFAILTVVFASILISFFDARPACRVKISELPQGRVAQCAAIYREILVREGCKVISERKSFNKNRVEFVFRLPRATAHEQLHDKLCAAPEDARGEIDWEVQ